MCLFGHMSFLSFLLFKTGSGSSSSRYKPSSSGASLGASSGGGGDDDDMGGGGGYDDDDDYDEDETLCSEEEIGGEKEDKKKEVGGGGGGVYTYLTGEAMTNRSVFLVAVGLLIIFFICVSKNGALDNVEWLSRSIIMVDYAAIRLQKLAILNMSNSRENMHGGSSTRPFVLVVGTTMASSRIGAPYSAMQAMGLSFRSLGLNTTCIVWVRDSAAENMDWCQGVGGPLQTDDWRVLVLSSKNATSVEMLVNHIMDVGGVGVMYVDATVTTTTTAVPSSPTIPAPPPPPTPITTPAPPQPAISTNGTTMTMTTTSRRSEGWPTSLLEKMLVGVNTEADMVFFESLSSGTGEGLDMPHMPVVDLSMFLVWNTPVSYAMFKDAAEWSHTIEMQEDEKKKTNQSQHLSLSTQKKPQYTRFIVNSLLNSEGRGEFRDHVRLMPHADLPAPVSDGFPVSECDPGAGVCCKKSV